MDADARDPVEFQQPVRRKRLILQGAVGQIGAAIAAVVVLTVGLRAVIQREVSTVKEPTVVATSQHPVFTPPPRMQQSFDMTSPDGRLRLVAYTSQKGVINHDYAETLYVLSNNGKPSQLLYHLQGTGSYFLSSQIFWFTEGSYDYLATLAPVSLSRTQFGENLVVERFTTDPQGVWRTTQQVSRLETGGLATLYKLDDHHLLLGNYNIGFDVPRIYSVTANGVTQSVVTKAFPAKGEIPDSVTRTLYVSGSTDASGATAFKISGDLSPLHMHLGQHLIIQVVYHTKVKLPLNLLPYGDVGGPGPGSLADRNPSPYTNALVFTIVNTAKHGSLVVVPVIPPGMTVSNADSLNKNFVKIPVVVQKG